MLRDTTSKPCSIGQSLTSSSSTAPLHLLRRYTRSLSPSNCRHRSACNNAHPGYAPRFHRTLHSYFCNWTHGSHGFWNFKDGNIYCYCCVSFLGIIVTCMQKLTYWAGSRRFWLFSCRIRMVGLMGLRGEVGHVSCWGVILFVNGF